MGPALQAKVRALATRPNGDLLAGGDFRTAGDQTSVHVATLTTTCPATATSFGTGCPSSAGSNTLTATTLPWVDATFRATGTGLPTLAIVIALTSVTAVVPPLALDTVFAEAATGCDLLVAPDIQQALFTSTGIAQSQLFLPNTPPLVGVTFCQQMIPIEIDASLNFIEITATNALQLTAGSF